MSNQIPIYSQVAPKSQYKAKNSKSARQNIARTDFDPLNYNAGGNFQILNSEARMEKKEVKKREETKARRDERRGQSKNEASEGKVEAYLRQYQVSIRQQQHRHSAVRQAEHRVNLR